MATNWLKLQTNIPIVGMPKYADVTDGQFGPQLKLTGTWDSLGDGSVGLPLDLAVGTLRTLGVIQGDEIRKPRDDGTEWVRYKVVGKKVRLLRTEDGKKKLTSITLADGSAPSAPAANGQPAARPQASAGEPPAVQFRRRVLTLGRCLDEVEAMLSKKFKNCSQDALMENSRAMAISLYIDLSSKNALAPLPPGPVTQEQLKRLADLALKAGWTDDHLMNEVRGITKTDDGDPKKLTDQQAKALITTLETMLARKEAERKAREEEERRKREESAKAQEAAAPAGDSYEGYSDSPGGEVIPF